MIFALILTVLILSGIALGLLLPIIAIIDILRSRFHGNENVLFILMVIFVPFGAILYFVLAPSRKIPVTF